MKNIIVCFFLLFPIMLLSNGYGVEKDSEIDDSNWIKDTLHCGTTYFYVEYPENLTAYIPKRTDRHPYTVASLIIRLDSVGRNTSSILLIYEHDANTMYSIADTVIKHQEIGKDTYDISKNSGRFYFRKVSPGSFFAMAYNVAASDTALVLRILRSTQIGWDKPYKYDDKRPPMWINDQRDP